jgi:hypothetical protein
VLNIGGLMRVVFWGVVLGLAGESGFGQTSCAIQHTGSGVFICFPNLSQHSTEISIPEFFHLSAQGNAPEGSTIARYIVSLDSQVVYDMRLVTPVRRLSIELNLTSPWKSGSHTLRVAIRGAGLAQMKGLFHPSENLPFCDPAGSLPTRLCNPSNLRSPLDWSLKLSQNDARDNSFSRYLAYRDRYRQNLKMLEADIADAVAVDSQGNLFVALHLMSGLELRKYSPNGSVSYGSVIRSCGPGFLAISGLVIDEAGYAWIAGNTSACLPVTSDALYRRIANLPEGQGFIAKLDTNKPSATAPLFLTYVSDVENQITGIRVDKNGSVYVVGTTGSAAFPHDASINLAQSDTSASDRIWSFVSVLNPEGSGLRWSTLIKDVRIRALALDERGGVYVTGQATASPAHTGNALLAELSRDGKDLRYLSDFGRGKLSDGRAVSVTSDGRWVVVNGETESPNAPYPSGVRSFAVALQPCRQGLARFELLPRDEQSVGDDIFVRPALDAWARTFNGVINPVASIQTGGSADVSVQKAPACAAQIERTASAPVHRSSLY